MYVHVDCLCACACVCVCVCVCDCVVIVYKLPLYFLQRDSGLWGALMIFCGLVGATIAGIIIDYTKKFKEVSVISVAFSVLCFVWFMEVGNNVRVLVSVCMGRGGGGAYDT